MDDPFVVRVLDRLCDLLQQFGGFTWGKWFVVEFCGKRFAVDITHRKIVLAFVFANFKDRHDAGMIETGSRFGFGIEPLHIFFRRQLPG